MRHVFVINPAAGERDRTSEIKRTIKATLETRAPQDTYEIYVTTGPMDAARFVRERAETGEELRVYACGGDGTLNECVNGAAGFANVALTHYPGGTGNDFIKIFGKGAEKFGRLDLLVDGDEKPVDLIRCNGRYSINICSVGIDARIGTEVHKYSGYPMFAGKGAYIISTIANIIKGINQFFTIESDGEAFEGEYALVCACNGRWYGGYFNPVPEAMPDDGLIDFLVIKKVSRIKFLQLVGSYKDGRYREMSEHIRHIRGKRLVIKSRNKMIINVDGEIVEDNTADFTVKTGMLRFFYPKGAEW